jgi:tRNA(fMet)-specific endonuclease VapC
MYLLDTDHFGILQRTSEPELTRVSARIQRCQPGDVFVSIISFHEQVSGWNAYVSRAKTSKEVIRGYWRFEKILRDFSTSQVLPFDAAAADVLNP